MPFFAYAHTRRALLQVEWDYAPTGEDLIDGVPLEDNEDAVVFIEDTPSLIGQKYMKVRNDDILFLPLSVDFISSTYYNN